MRNIIPSLLAIVLSFGSGVAGAATSHSVTTKPLNELAIFPESDVPAVTLTLNQPMLSAQISGRIVATPVMPGDRVAAGSVLISLDCRDYEAQLAQASAALEAVSAQLELTAYRLERVAELAAKESTSQELLELRKTEHRATQADSKARKAARELAQLAVERCMISAPFAAVVVSRPAQLGALAVPGQPLVELVDLSSIELAAQIPSAALAEVQSSATTLWFHTRQERYPVVLRALLPQQGSRTEMHEARLLFSGKNPLPGTPGRLVWRDSRAHLPPDLVERRRGKLGVFWLDGTIARFQPLDRAQEGRPTVVELPAGTQIVIDGRANIQPDEAVVVSR